MPGTGLECGAPGPACDPSHRLAVLQSVWVKTGALQWWCDWKPHKWVDVRVALEQFTGHDGVRDSILFIYYVVHEEKKVGGGARGEVRGGVGEEGGAGVGCVAEGGGAGGWGVPGEGLQSRGAGVGTGHGPRGAWPRTACGICKAPVRGGSSRALAGRRVPASPPAAAEGPSCSR